MMSLWLAAQTPKQIKQAQEMMDRLTPEQKKMMEPMGINPNPMKQSMADQNNFIPKVLFQGG